MAFKNKRDSITPLTVSKSSNQVVYQDNNITSQIYPLQLAQQPAEVYYIEVTSQGYSNSNTIIKQ